jgi:1-deoxy-D-xylulose-5-phosphate synthase
MKELVIYLAPSTKSEYKNMLKFATTLKNHPVGIRVPAEFSKIDTCDNTDYTIYNKNKIVLNGNTVAIFAIGKMMDMALDIAKKVKQEKNLDITVINPLFLTGLDETLLNDLKKNHKLVITLEDGELMGGYGQNISSFYGTSDILVKNFSISKKCHTDFTAEDLLKETVCRLKIYLTL